MDILDLQLLINNNMEVFIVIGIILVILLIFSFVKKMIKMAITVGILIILLVFGMPILKEDGIDVDIENIMDNTDNNINNNP